MSIPALIMVAGVGGAGGNAINHVHSMGIHGVNLVLFNTDKQDLDRSPVEHKVLLGDGLGAGNDPKTGEEKAKESMDAIRDIFTGMKTKMLFLAAGMGGGTGTGATPVIAEVAREMGILTVAIVTMCNENEGHVRFTQAKEGIQRLAATVDSIIVIKDKALSELYGDLPISECFNKANDIVAKAAKGLAEIITIKSNLVNVDFNDVRKVMKDSGTAVLGVSEAEGEDRAVRALQSSLECPLFGDAKIEGAKDVLINFATSSKNPLITSEKDAAINHIQELATCTDPDGKSRNANVIWGTSIKEELEDKMEVIVVVTGFGAEVFSETESKPKNENNSAQKTEIKTSGIAKRNKKRLEYQERRYDYVERMKQGQPAYIRRKAELVIQIISKKKAVANSNEEELPVNEECTQQTLF